MVVLVENSIFGAIPLETREMKSLKIVSLWTHYRHSSSSVMSNSGSNSLALHQGSSWLLENQKCNEIKSA